MLPFITLISLDKKSKTPIFIQIANSLTEHIRKGTIPPGAKLPGSRSLAGSLGVHRKTVVAAYEELLAQGWLESKGARGTFVSGKLPVVKPVFFGKNAAASQRNRMKAGFEFYKKKA